MKLPTFGELSEDQLLIWEHDPDQALFVLGPPGSGKTSLAIWRARFVSAAPLSRSVKIVTRNRLLVAAAEHHAHEAAGPRGFSATTFNSFVVTDYFSRFRAHAPQFVPFSYDWNRIIEQYAEAGIAPTLDHLIIDEGQNLPSGFFVWAVRFGARVVTVFADEDQTTLPERSSIADIVRAGMPRPMRLSENYRNSEEIAALMERFHQSGVLPPAIVRVAATGELPALRAVDDWDGLVDMVATRFRNRGTSIGVIVENAATVLDLSRKLRHALEHARVDSYTSETIRGAEAGIRMLEPGVTVLTGESAIGLEFESVFLQDLSRSLPIAGEADRRRLYMLCARACRSLVLVDGRARLTTAQLASLPDDTYLER